MENTCNCQDKCLKPDDCTREDDTRLHQGMYGVGSQTPYDGESAPLTYQGPYGHGGNGPYS